MKEESLDKWIDKHPILSTLIGLSVMVVLAIIIVWVFKIGWDTIPPTINEIVENVSKPLT